MISNSSAPMRNRLLARLSEDDLSLLRPHFRRGPLTRKRTLIHPDRPIEIVHFPEDGVVSVVAELIGGGQSKIGIFGREGMSGPGVLLGVDTSPHSTYVQVEGASALEIDTPALLEAVAFSATLRAVLLRYVHAFNVQVAHTAVSNANHTLMERLARWLLMCQDRLEADDVELTHEFMAMMLAVRRTGVTETLHLLEGRGLIRARRGRVTLLDRAGLEEMASDAYGKPEAEYRRLFEA